MLYGTRIVGLALALVASSLVLPMSSAFAQEDSASVEKRLKELERKFNALEKKVDGPWNVEIQTEPSARPFCQQWNVGPGNGAVVLLPCAPELGQKTWHLVPKK